MTQKETIQALQNIEDKAADFPNMTEDNWVATAKRFLQEQFKKVYVVIRCEEHSDYVERVFFDKNKAEEYCVPYNENEHCYSRDITEIDIII